MSLEKYINIDKLQELQECFSRATGFAVVTVDYRGIPILNPSGFSKFCEEVRKIDYYRTKCFHCDSFSSMESARTGKTSIYYCHAGLVDFSVPIIIDGAFLGAVMCGQTLIENPPKELVSLIDDDEKILQKEPQLQKHFAEIQRVSYEKLYESTKLLSNNIKLIISESYLKKENSHLNKLYEDKLSEALDLTHVYSYTHKSRNKHRFFLSALNVIHKQVYLGNIQTTENILISTSKLYRYFIKDYENIIPIKKEINYIKDYKLIQNLRFGEFLKIILNYDENILHYCIPHLTLLNFIDSLLNFSIEPKEYLGNINVDIVKEDKKLKITIEDNGLGVDVNKVIQFNDKSYFKTAEATPDDEDIFDVFSKLHHFFKDDFTLHFSNKKDGGAKIVIIIPAVLEQKFVNNNEY